MTISFENIGMWVVSFTSVDEIFHFGNSVKNDKENPVLTASYAILGLVILGLVT